MFSNCTRPVRILFNGFRLYSAQSSPNPEGTFINTQHLSGLNTGITVLSLNRPQTKNALNTNLIIQLHEQINILEDDKEVRVLVVKSDVPGVFCAGADLKERLSTTPQEIPQKVHMIRSLMQKFYELPVPVIVALDGVAFGGGLELALGCDIRIASTNSKMGLVETRLGIIPGAGGTQRLPRIINPAIARELIYTARIFDGSKAKELGVVNHVVEQNTNGNAAYCKAIEIAKEILPNGPVGVRMAKLAIRKGLDENLEAGLKVEQCCYLHVIPTEDRLEGIRAFTEKRQPKFKGY